MRLTLTRTHQTPTATLGTLTLDDGETSFYTLELPVKDGLPGSAIPVGTYRVALLPSPKFENLAMVGHDAFVEEYAGLVPRLLTVPNRSGILIHWGNYVKDTDGCILVGKTQEVDQEFIGLSREAFAALHARLEAAPEDIWIEVVGEAESGGLEAT